MNDGWADARGHATKIKWTLFNRVRLFVRVNEKKGTHASYMPAPTMFRGRTIPVGPPAPSLLGSSVWSSRNFPFLRDVEALVEIRDMQWIVNREA